MSQFAGCSIVIAFLCGTNPVANDPFFRYQVSYYDTSGDLELLLSSRRGETTARHKLPGIHLNLLPAWEITKGSSDVIVAVLDDGFYYDHEDLRDNLWRNAGETGLDSNGVSKAINGLDDDGNGYVDDVIGWDFAFNDPEPDAYAFDGLDASTIAPYSHGNRCIGIIGARGGNNLGIAGINWFVSLMPLRVGAQGTPRHYLDARRIDRSAAAIRYAVDNGARIISWSQFVSDHRPHRLQLLQEAIDHAEAHGVLIVVAAGNEGLDIDQPKNASYPACFPNENLIVVAEVDFSGQLDRTVGGRFRSASSFGCSNVDIAAIGRNYTIDVYHGQNIYAMGGGTSCATPVVAGVAALMLAVNPSLEAVELKRMLMDSAKPLDSLRGKVSCGGMVDAHAAVVAAARPKSAR